MIDNWCWCYMVHCIMCYSIKGTIQQNTIFTFLQQVLGRIGPLVFYTIFSLMLGQLSPCLIFCIMFFLFFFLGVGALSPILFFTPKMLGHFHPPNFLHLFFYKHTNNYLTMKVKNTGHGVNNIMFLFIWIKFWFWGMSN